MTPKDTKISLDERIVSSWRQIKNLLKRHHSAPPFFVFKEKTLPILMVLQKNMGNKLVEAQERKAK